MRVLTVSRSAVRVAAFSLLAAGVGVGAVSPALANPADDPSQDAAKNNPAWWESYFQAEYPGVDCKKYDGGKPTWTVPARDGDRYIAAIVNAAARPALGGKDPNEVVYTVAAGDTLEHFSGKDISHVILCWVPKPPPTSSTTSSTTTTSTGTTTTPSETTSTTSTGTTTTPSETTSTTSTGTTTTPSETTSTTSTGTTTSPSVSVSGTRTTAPGGDEPTDEPTTAPTATPSPTISVLGTKYSAGSGGGGLPRTGGVDLGASLLAGGLIGAGGWMLWASRRRPAHRA